MTTPESQQAVNRPPRELLDQSDSGRWTLTFNSGVRWLFDPTGTLTAREFEGQRVTVTQSPDRRPTIVQHSSGHSLTMTYEDGGLVSVRADDDPLPLVYGAIRRAARQKARSTLPDSEASAAIANASRVWVTGKM